MLFRYDRTRFLRGLKEYADMELIRGLSLFSYSIAEKVGIPDTTYFHRLFKKHTGVTPEEFRSDPEAVSIS